MLLTPLSKTFVFNYKWYDIYIYIYTIYLVCPVLCKNKIYKKKKLKKTLILSQGFMVLQIKALKGNKNTVEEHHFI